MSNQHPPSVKEAYAAAKSRHCSDLSYPSSIRLFDDANDDDIRFLFEDPDDTCVVTNPGDTCVVMNPDDTRVVTNPSDTSTESRK